MKRISLAIRGLLAGMAITVMTGCGVPKDVAYFQDLDAVNILESAKVAPIKVKPGDKLSIVVKSKDTALSALFNLPLYSSRIGTGSTSGTGSELRAYTGSTSESVASYTVTPEGTIDFPVLGYIKVEGMTRSELAGFIKGELMGRELVKDPTVVVEFLSAGVSVMGEVNRPGRYDLNRDNLNILEAIALAGDLTITGQRKNVRVIRMEDGKANTYTLNLTDAKSMVNTPGFYLQQGDVVYVEPNDMRKRQTTVNGNNTLSTSFWISVASLITSAVTTIGVFIK